MKFRVPTAGFAALGVLSSLALSGGIAAADPGQDGVLKLKELTQQAEQLIGSVQSAQLDLDKKLKILDEAEQKHAADVAALTAAKDQLAVHQGFVDTAAAAIYMGGRTDGLNAVLTAASPAALIDELSIQKMMTDEMATQMQGFRRISQEAQAVEAASAESAVQAKVAADAAAALRADLQKKQSELQTKVALVKATYSSLPAPLQTVLGPGAAIPTVGMGGLVPNARALAAYIIATYPGVQSIGGVRADPLPDHPSGHAIDIMIGGDMALGDAINADVLSKAGQFGVSYTMWRVAAHFDHVHITVH